MPASVQARQRPRKPFRLIAGLLANLLGLIGLLLMWVVVYLGSRPDRPSERFLISAPGCTTRWYISLVDGVANFGKLTNCPARVHLSAFTFADLNGTNQSLLPIRCWSCTFEQLFGLAHVEIVESVQTVISLRTWLAVLIGSMLFALQIAWMLHPVARLRRARRRRLGQCTSCGYSLVGNLSGVCPECGDVAASAARQTGAAGSR